MILTRALIGTVISVFWTTASVEGHRWSCSSNDAIADVRGNICCNSEVAGWITTALEETLDLQEAAVSLRDRLEKKYGDLWEAVVGYKDFGYATYRRGQFHCKHSIDNGFTAMVWKVMKSSKAPANKKRKIKSTKSSSSSASFSKASKSKPAPKKTTKPPKKTTPAPKKLSPAEQLQTCCEQNKGVDPKCHNGAAGVNLCDYNSLQGDKIIQVYLQKICPLGSLGEVLMCASNRQDHTKCCQAAGVPANCNMFCNPAAGLRELRPDEFLCVGSLAKIRGCFIHYAETGKVKNG